MKIVCIWVYATLLFSLEHIRVNWLRYHTFWAPCGIGMKIEGILKFCFWISLHQGMQNSRLQAISHEWSRSVIVASAVCFVWDAKPDFPTRDATHWRFDPKEVLVMCYPNPNQGLIRTNESNHLEALSKFQTWKKNVLHSHSRPLLNPTLHVGINLWLSNLDLTTLDLWYAIMFVVDDMG